MTACHAAGSSPTSPASSASTTSRQTGAGPQSPTSTTSSLTRRGAARRPGPRKGCPCADRTGRNRQQRDVVAGDGSFLECRQDLCPCGVGVVSGQGNLPAGGGGGEGR